MSIEHEHKAASYSHITLEYNTDRGVLEYSSDIQSIRE